jgi:CubicO group peptidase (beta-lactamase class C family)
MRNKLYALGAVIILVAFAALGQAKTIGQPQSDETSSAKIDQLFAQWDKPDSPGAAVAVVKDGAVAYQKGYGSANLEYDIPIVPSSVFNIGSVSKQFTTFAVTTLAQQGKLSLDDDIRQYVTEVPDFGKTITIRHLMNHTSGLRSHWPLFALAGWRLNDDVTTNDDVLRMVERQRELNFDPGDEYLYCNTGYTLLAELVDRVTGMSFRDYTQKHIFEPLGMNDSHFHDDHEMIIKNRTYAYKLRDGVLKKSISNNEVVGNGHLYTTAEDLTKWMVNLKSGAIGGKAVIEQMEEPGVLNNGDTLTYALGLVVNEYRGLRRIGHGGSHSSYRAYLGYFPERDFGVVVLSNLGSFNPSRLAMQVADVYLQDVFPEPPSQQPANVSQDDYQIVNAPEEQLRRMIGHYYLPEDNAYRRIYLKDGQLYYDRDGQNESPLAPLADGRFLMLGVPSELILQEISADSEAPTRLRWYRNGEESSLLESYEPWSPSPMELTDYTGRYYSPELKTFYTLVVKEDTLVATHARNDDRPLRPCVRGKFQIGFNQVWFEADGGGQITGFRITTGRVRNLLFERQEGSHN